MSGKITQFCFIISSAAPFLAGYQGGTGAARNPSIIAKETRLNPGLANHEL
jgi:hypothetical protein